MPLSTATITGDIADMVGTDFDSRRTKVWVTTNVESDTVIDTDGNAIRLGSGAVTLNSDGTFSAVVWVPGTGSNPDSWQTYINVSYPDPATRERKTRTFGPFTVTTSANLADLVEEQEVPAEYLTTVTELLQGYVDDAEAAAATAVDISNISTSDDVVAALLDDETSETTSRLTASIASTAGIVGARRVLFLGTSITDSAGASDATYGFPSMTAYIGGSANIVATVSGHPSERADQIATYLEALIDDGDFDHVHVEVGPNDASQGRTLAQFQTAVQSILDTARRCGVAISFSLVSPRGASATAADAKLRLYNLWLAQWARQNGVNVADTFTAIADTATGFLAAAYDSGDGTHPNQAGHRELARAVAPVVVADQKRYTGRDFLTSPIGLIANPIMAGGSIAGWSLLAGAAAQAYAASEAGDGLLFGGWHRLHNTSPNSTAVAGHILDPTKYSAGDVLLVHARVNHIGTPGGNTQISFRNDATNVAFPFYCPVEVGVPGEILAKVTVPASGLGTLRICHSAYAPAGGYIDSHLGECQVVNLTTGGLVDAF